MTAAEARAELKMTRKRLGWTQAKMAKDLKISLRTYTRAELCSPSGPVAKLAHYLEVEHSVNNHFTPMKIDVKSAQLERAGA